MLRGNSRGVVRHIWANTSFDPSFSSVALLMHFDGGNGSTTFTDSSSNNTAITTVNSAAQSNTQVKFGPSSFASGPAGSPPYLTASNANVQFGTNPWTVEFWYYYNSATAIAFGTFVDGGNNTTGWVVQFGGVITNLVIGVNGSGSGAVAHGMTTGNWYHIAAVRDASNVFRLYVGGVQIGSKTTTATCNPTGSLTIGTDSAGLTTLPMTSFMDELRITAGICRYPGGTTFAPPTAPFPNH